MVHLPKHLRLRRCTRTNLAQGVGQLPIRIGGHYEQARGAFEADEAVLGIGERRADGDAGAGAVAAGQGDHEGRVVEGRGRGIFEPVGGGEAGGGDEKFADGLGVHGVSGASGKCQGAGVSASGSASA